MFIKPVKRSSTFKKFTKHEDILISADRRFCLQKRKNDSASHYIYRIILLGNPYYEVAYSNDLNQLKEREWRYITEEIPVRIPIDRPEREIVPWIISHFTCLAIELGSGITQPDDDDDDIENSVVYNVPSTPRSVASSNVLPSSVVSSSTSSSTALTTSSTALTTHSTDVTAPIQPAPKIPYVQSLHSRHKNTNDKALYPGSSYTLRGFIPFIMCIVLFNIPTILLREASYDAFFYSLMILDIIIGFVVLFGIPISLGVSRMTTAKRLQEIWNNQHKNSKNKKNDEINDNLTSLNSVSEASSDSNDNDTDTAEDGIDLDERLRRIKNAGNSAPASLKGVIPGSVVGIAPASNPTQNGTISDPQGQSFAVRCGPNYNVNKKKAPSSKALFDLLGADVFQSEKKILHIAKLIDLEKLYNLPVAPYVDVKSDVDVEYQQVVEAQRIEPLPHIVAQKEATDKENAQGWKPEVTPKIYPDATGKLPPKAARSELLPGFHFGTVEKPFLWIICMQIPTYAPSAWSPTEDGEGMNLVWYLRATPETQRDLMRETPVSPAVRVLKNFVLMDPADATFQKNYERFKNIPRLVNTRDFDLGYMVNNLIKSYNGKPFLTRPQGVFHRGPGYANYDLDIHCFCYTAKKVLHGFLDKMDRVILDWGFCVEAYDDEEQPEVMLGQIRLNKIQFQAFPSWEKTIAFLDDVRSGKQQPSDAVSDTSNTNNIVSTSPTPASPGLTSVNESVSTPKSTVKQRRA